MVRQAYIFQFHLKDFHYETSYIQVYKIYSQKNNLNKKEYCHNLEASLSLALITFLFHP